MINEIAASYPKRRLAFFFVTLFSKDIHEFWKADVTALVGVGFQEKMAIIFTRLLWCGHLLLLRYTYLLNCFRSCQAYSVVGIHCDLRAKVLFIYSLPGRLQQRTFFWRTSTLLLSRSSKSMCGMHFKHTVSMKNIQKNSLSHGLFLVSIQHWKWLLTRR